MPGFYVSTGVQKPCLNNAIPTKCIEEIHTVGGYTYARNTLNKFMADKLFDETERYVLITEGVILNKTSLMTQYKQSSWRDTVLSMIAQDSETFFQNFEGPFSGAVYDKDIGQWLFFTNQTGETPLFYYQNAETKEFIVASQVNYILDNIPREMLHLDERAAIDMLTFAYMEGDETYAKEIRRLPGGGVMVLAADGKYKLTTYHRFSRNKYDLSQIPITEIIDTLDAKFRAAIKLEFDKDREYGYRHLVDLSGGLDSRMTSWVAHSIGYTQQQNITYCQANSADEMIAKQIAAELQHELLVKPLDDINFMYDAEKTVQMNYGLSLYCGITGGRRMLSSLNIDQYGIEHTGMIGDVVIGSFLKNESELALQTPAGMYSNKYSDKVTKEYHQAFEDHEQYLLYVRGFHGACATHMIRTNYTATWSPFMNTDFFEFCLSIPLKLRCNHQIYKQWILTKYPEAAKFKWETTGLRISAGKLQAMAYKLVTKGPGKLARLCKIPVAQKKGMNPTDYWYSSNEKLRDYFETIYSATIGMKILDNELKENITELYQTGGCMEKAQVITLLLALQQYFGEKEFEKTIG